MSNLTEYFQASDFCYLLTEAKKTKGISKVELFINFFKSVVLARKEATFPMAMRPSNLTEDNIPDWTTEIGGLRAAKDTIEDMFGVT